MFIDEVVVLPLPRSIKAIRTALLLFEHQYHVIARLQVQGHVQLVDQGTLCEIPLWHDIGDLDYDLDALGLGGAGDLWESLAWVYPVGPGQLRISFASPQQQDNAIDDAHNKE